MTRREEGRRKKELSCSGCDGGGGGGGGGLGLVWSGLLV